MERQYIGARYVPKFADPVEWDNQRSFEALTIVTYMGASYTSKKAVPAGVKPTDTNYWVATGNYNAQVEQYRQEVVKVVDDVETTIEGFNTDTKKFVDGLINNVKQLEGKKIMVIGDSLSDPTTMPPNWVAVLRNLISEYDVNCVVNTDFCINGESYSGFGLASNLAKLDNYADEWDIIVIALGVNDYQGQWGIGFYNDTTVESDKEGYNGYNFTAGMNNTLRKLREKFPSAIQYGIVPHRTGRSVTNMKTPIALYRYAIGTMLQYYGARIIDLSSMPMFAPAALGDSFGGYTSASDKLHPSSVYAPILCNYMLQNINNGGANNWKLSGNKASIPVLAEAVGAEGGIINVTYTSDGRIRVACAISCDADVTGQSYIVITDNVTDVIKNLFLIPKVCTINDGAHAEIGALGSTLYVSIPAGVTKLSAIYLDIIGDSTFPMNHWRGIAD